MSAKVVMARIATKFSQNSKLETGREKCELLPSGGREKILGTILTVILNAIKCWRGGFLLTTSK
jgi:hypothetical protein